MLIEGVKGLILFRGKIEKILIAYDIPVETVSVLCYIKIQDLS